jgi:hypothetical protein
LYQNCLKPERAKVRKVQESKIKIRGRMTRFVDSGFCKFTVYCSFSHNVQHFSNDGLEKEIKDIKKELLLLKDKENENDKQMKKLKMKLMIGKR